MPLHLFHLAAALVLVRPPLWLSETAQHRGRFVTMAADANVEKLAARLEKAMADLDALDEHEFMNPIGGLQDADDVAQRTRAESEVSAAVGAISNAGLRFEDVLGLAQADSNLGLEQEEQKEEEDATSTEQTPLIRWTHTTDAIYLELRIDQEVGGNDVDVELRNGQLAVTAASETLLSGRLMQPVLGSELIWAFDVSAEGHRLLCIELPKKRHEPDVDSVFEDGLLVHGAACQEPGLTPT